MATLRNHRVVTVLRDGEGRPLAEVADDTVTASASGPDGAAELQAWREVEVELLDGDEALLAPVGEWLVAAGARASDSSSKLGRVLSSRLPAAPATEPQESTAGEVVLAAVRGQVAALQAADVDLRIDAPDAVHQLRVAARRLRSILAAFRPVLDRAATEPLRTELSWLGGELGQARDDEVALAHLRELVSEQPPELVLGPVAARLQQTAIRSAAAGREQALATLTSERYLRLLDALHALLDEPPFASSAGDPARPVFLAAVRKAGERLLRRVRTAERADGDARDVALHEVRKAGKRLRYTAEVGELGPGKPPKKLVKAAKRVQTTLGTLQDTVVTRDVCRRLAIEAAAAGENAFTFGHLHGLEQARAESARAAFADLEPDLLPTLRAALRT